jgi:hypothetical protein
VRHSLVVFVVLTVALLICGSSWAASMQFSLYFNRADLSFEKRGLYDLIQLDGCEIVGEVGEPALPRRLVRIAIPSGFRARSIRITSFETETVDGAFDVYPVQPEVPISLGRQADWVDPDPNI